MIYEFEPGTGTVWIKNSCAVETINQISLLAIDYDGVGNSIQGLKDLINEMRSLADEAIDYIYNGKIFPDMDAELESQQLASAQAREYLANQEEE